MSKFHILFLIVFGALIKSNAQHKTMPTSIYDFTITSLDGEKIDLLKYNGKKILIVNTASECGYTPQYEGLETLYQKYKDKLVVIAFPCNDFGQQEPGTDKEIKNFCKKNYGVSFPVTTKISVLGPKQHPIYTWLTDKQYNHFENSIVKWNFQKYLLDEKGNLIAVFPSKVDPMSTEITSNL